jgi:hypothetical protein
MPEHLDMSRAEEASRRRSHRLLLRVPLSVRGETEPGKPFVENVVTMVVNAHGGLILLQAPVKMGHLLRITHQQTNVEIEATVVFIGSAQEGKTQVGFEFRERSPKFWQIGFPPSDWGPSS